jgi:hypothetical protein
MLLPKHDHHNGSLPRPIPLRHSLDGTKSERAKMRILSVGKDEPLLASRAGVLGITGCTVLSARPEQAGKLIASEVFHLVVFGHTLSDRELAELAVFTRQLHPQTRLLATCFEQRPSSIEQLFDATVECHAGPAALVNAANELLGKKAPGNTSMFPVAAKNS